MKKLIWLSNRTFGLIGFTFIPIIALAFIFEDGPKKAITWTFNQWKEQWDSGRRWGLFDGDIK